MSQRSFIFSGQGSQFIGMGKDLAESYPAAKAVFDEIDSALNQNLSHMMFDGETEALNLTENTQPALMAVSMAVMRIIEKETGKALPGLCDYVAGHSLGEYSALTAAGCFDISTAAKILKTRGQAMQHAVPIGVGAMAAILGLDFTDVQNIAEHATKDSSANEICQSANDNSIGQVVVSGHVNAVNRAIELASEAGAKRAVLLPVSAPFHCALMQPAAEDMQAALDEITINAPSVPLVANITAQATQDPAEIKDLLIQQITGTVRWRESVQWMAGEGVNEMVEIGAGKVLSGLIRRIDRDITCQNVGTAGQTQDFVAALS